MNNRVRRPGWVFALAAFNILGMMAPTVLLELRVLGPNDVWPAIVIWVSALLVMLVGYWLTQTIPTNEPEE
jgi:hypothetical protein